LSSSALLRDAEPVLIAGQWRAAAATGTFRAVDPTTGLERPQHWPVSGWSDVEAALDAAVGAAATLASLPGARLADFLERYADRLAARGDDLVAVAHAESGLDVTPRLFDVELPRTLDQLRQAAAAAREGTWRMGMIDSTRNIRSAAFGLGPVVVFPPANFPLAYGAVTGGDFAAAIAGGNPVIAKAHPGNPGVSRLAAEEAVAAVHDTELPPATVQLLHGISLEDGERLVADSRVGGTGFTGGQEAGKRLYAAAAATGRVIWVEMGSINPVVLLPGALAERGSEIAGELTASVTGSAGQFCTKPGLVFLIDDNATATFARVVAERFNAIGAQVLLGPVGRDRLVAAIAHLEKAGTRVLAGGGSGDGPCSHRPTLLEVPAAFLVARPQALLIEAFGNATVLVRCASVGELLAALACVPGALAASVYSSREGRDDAIVGPVAASLVARAGRIIENRMPTGLAVTPPMQHGGPWPSAGPPFFSAVGMPWSILRFARRICFDGWSQNRLPECLRDEVPEGQPWRFVDATWTRGV
jgi:NADP-dependent aldehyde dehydrogenase